MTDSRLPQTADESDRISATYGHCDGEPAYIIEDPRVDGAWLAISADDEVELCAWE